MFGFLFILLDISLFAVLSFPFYKLFCGETIFFSLFDYFLLKLNNIFFFPICLDLFFFSELFCSNLCVCMIDYNFFFYDWFIYEFFFLFLYFFIYSSCGIINLVDPLVEIFLYTRRASLGLIEFYSLQRSVRLFFDEIGLVFFRVYNPLQYTYVNFFIYLVYPLFYSIYVNKIQCFCFESLIVNPFEVLDLPVLFFVSSDIRFEFVFLFVKLAFLYIHFLG